MLNFDKLKGDFYDPKLGMLKIGVLLARRYPERIDDLINCRSLTEIAILMEIPSCESIHRTGVQLLQEWLEAKGLL